MISKSSNFSEIGNAGVLKKYVCIEVGKSAYTEYKMLSGDFEKTEDGIFLDIVFAIGKNEAIECLKTSQEHKGKEFGNIILFEVL